MNDEKLKKQIGANIASYRKRLGMTQAGLAEKLNYSDKAVSKWERGESVPDVLILCQLAELYQITVNDLVEDPNELPENSDSAMERLMGRAVEKTLKRKADKRIILSLSSVLVWFIALLTFVTLSFFDFPNTWMVFVYAIPADAIVLLSLRSAWHDFRWNKMLISGIVWGSLLSIYITATFWNFNLWKIFLLGILGQVAIFLWFRMFRPVKEQVQEVEK